MKQRLEQLQNAKLEELAQDPRNIVYRYTDRPALAQPVPLDIVAKNVDDLWSICKHMSCKHAAKRRQLVCEMEPRFLKFSETHPSIFDRVVHPDTTEDMIQLLREMMQQYRHATTAGENMTEAKQRFEQHVVASRSMSEEEYKRRYPNAQVHDMPEEPSETTEERAEDE